MIICPNGHQIEIANAKTVSINFCPFCGVRLENTHRPFVLGNAITEPESTERINAFQSVILIAAVGGCLVIGMLIMMFGSSNSPMFGSSNPSISDSGSENSAPPAQASEYAVNSDTAHLAFSCEITHDDGDKTCLDVEMQNAWQEIKIVGPQVTIYDINGEKVECEPNGIWKDADGHSARAERIIPPHETIELQSCCAVYGYVTPVHHPASKMEYDAWVGDTRVDKFVACEDKSSRR